MSGSLVMNVFRQDAFSALTLTDQVNRVPYKPSLLGSLAIFEPFPIFTTDLEVDRKDSVLSLVQTSPRGAPGKQRTVEKRQARYFTCPRLMEEDVVYASQLQNVRSEQVEMALKTLQECVAIRLTGPSGLTSQIEYTKEYHRLGAIQGILLDADGTPINNWFNEFGISQPAEIAFDLLNVGAAPAGYVRKACNNIHRQMARAGKGAFIDNVTEVHALAGDLFFDNFVNHVDVVQTYANWSAAQELRQGRAFDSFTFGGIVWHNYRGSDDNSTIAIPVDRAKFFPVKAPGVFKEAQAPGETFADMNQKGKPLYVERQFDPAENPKWVKFEVMSYPLHICTRPEMLLSARAGV